MGIPKRRNVCLIGGRKKTTEVNSFHLKKNQNTTLLTVWYTHSYSTYPEHLSITVHTDLSHSLGVYKISDLSHS